jgi:UDP-2,3-diacylglucosamine pyrophosphatase LpxH
MDNKEKILVDTLIISDIHLGDTSTDCYGVFDVLSKYRYKKLILNGDILDGLNLNRLRTDHWKILSKLRKLSKTCEVVWIHGNHDPDIAILSKLLGVRAYNRYIWEEGGKKYLAIHGHQFDRFMNDNIIISYLAFGIYALSKKIDPAGNFIGWIKRNNRTWKRNSSEVAKGAASIAKLLGAQCVICGHTHIIDSDEINGVKYFNTGSWVDGESAYLVIKEGKAELIRPDKLFENWDRFKNNN